MTNLTVQFSLSIYAAAGLPTILLLPTTTTSIPSKFILKLFNIVNTALGVKENIKSFIETRKLNGMNMPKVASILVGNDGGSLFNSLIFLINSSSVTSSFK